MKRISTLLCLILSFTASAQINEILRRESFGNTLEVKVMPYICRWANSFKIVNMPPSGIPRITRDTSDLVLSLGPKRESMLQSLEERMPNPGVSPVLSKTLTGKIVWCGMISSKTPDKDTIKPCRFKIRCGRVPAIAPLIVIDNVPYPNSDTLSKIKPNTIESITIIKAAEATAIYGSQATEGVIILITKKVKMRYDAIIIRDMVDKTAISKATISFVFPERKDTLRYIADDSGVVVSNSLPKLEGCEMIVSAVGYKTESSLFSFNRQKPPGEIFLTRDVKNCPEVIITCFDCIRTIRCGGYRIKITRGTEEKTSIIENNKLILYPNPVARGGLINIEYPVIEDKLLLSVTSIDGKTMLSRPFSAAGREQLHTGLWPGGTYFIRLLYANGRQAASQKLVIQ